MVLYMRLKWKVIIFDLRYISLLQPSLMVPRWEFRIEFQFLLTDCDGDDEGHVVFLKVTALTILVGRLLPGTCCSCCAIGMYRKHTAC